MRKTIFKILMIVLIICSLFTVRADELTNFEIKFKEPDAVNMGETVEIPLYIHKVSIPGEVRGVLSFECDIEYDENIMEILPYEKEENGQTKEVYIDANQDLLDYSTQIFFNNETKKLVFSLNTSYFQNVANSLTELTEIGKMKFKIKEGVSTGDYELVTSSVEAGNIYAQGHRTLIHVNGVDDETARIEPEIDGSLGTNTDSIKLRTNGIDVTVDIKVTSDGKTIIITPDEVNGSEIGYIIINNKRIDKNNGKFIFDSEPNSEYTVYFYGIDGTFIANKFVTTYIDENNQSQKDEPKQEKKEEQSKKTLKTGDYIAIAIGTAILAIGSILLVVFVKKNENKNE